jgi:NAD-dependent deacetylase
VSAREAEIAALAEGLVGASRLLVITGAGMSADAGIPTYRGVGGLYDGHPGEDGLAIEDILSAEVFAARPALTWRALFEIEARARGVEPHVGHRVLAAIEAARSAAGRETLVATQNVDGLHQAAGSRAVVELHGSIRTLSCARCGARRAVAGFSGLALPPRCAACGGVERPDVVQFGEALPRAALERYLAYVEAEPDAVLSVGTTSGFAYVYQPIVHAAARGAWTAEIDPGETALSSVVGLRVCGRAAEVLAAVGRASALAAPPAD